MAAAKTATANPRRASKTNSSSANPKAPGVAENVLSSAWNNFGRPLVNPLGLPFVDRAAQFLGRPARGLARGVDEVGQAALEPFGGGRTPPPIGESPTDTDARSAMFSSMLNDPSITLSPEERATIQYMQSDPNLPYDVAIDYVSRIRQRGENNQAKQRYLQGFDQTVQDEFTAPIQGDIDKLNNMLMTGDYMSDAAYNNAFTAVQNQIGSNERNEESLASQRAVGSGIRGAGFSQDQLRRTRDAGAVARGGTLAGFAADTQGRKGNLENALRSGRTDFGLQRAQVEGTPDEYYTAPPNITDIAAAKRNQVIGGNQFGTGLAANVFGPLLNPGTYMGAGQAGSQILQNTIGMFRR